MNILHIWFDLKDSYEDVAFAEAADQYLGLLKERGAIAGWRLTRRKLGLGPAEIGEFHMAIEADNLAQLDAAFDLAAARTGLVQQLHAAVYSRVVNAKFALYRDFPDPVRQAAAIPGR